MGGPTAASLSTRVVRSLADARDVAPTDLEFRLGDTIDTDALDALAAHDGADWELEFEVEGHEVTITPGEPVKVDGTPYR